MERAERKMAESRNPEAGFSLIRTGGECGQCGFHYQAHQGHIIPCPRCRVAQLEAMLDRLCPGWRESEALAIKLIADR
jgi:predicted Zn-ribbon and HTH transcriptional regulator